MQLKCTRFQGKQMYFEKEVAGTKSRWLRGWKFVPCTVVML